MVDKQQLEKIYVHSLKVKKVLFIISMCLYGLAIAALISYIVLKVNGFDILLIPDFLELEYFFTSFLMDIFSMTLAGAIITLLFSRLIYGRRAIMSKAMLENYDQIVNEQSKMYNTMPNASPIVDVKPTEEKPKGKYDDLIKEYTKLCEQGLISKEELANKKKELGYND